MLATTLAIAGAIVATAAAIAAAVQVRLLRKQMEHSSRLAVATLYQQIAGRFVEFDAFLVDHPHLYPFFYDNEPMPVSGSNRAEVRMMAEMVYDLAEFCHANASVLGSHANNWDNYFHKMFQTSPALQAYAEEYEAFYPPSVRIAFQSGDLSALN